MAFELQIHLYLKILNLMQLPNMEAEVCEAKYGYNTIPYNYRIIYFDHIMWVLKGASVNSLRLKHGSIHPTNVSMDLMK